MRRLLKTGLFLFLIMAAFQPMFSWAAQSAAYTGVPAAGETKFRIYMDGKYMGTHTARFTPMGDGGMKVRTKIEMRYKLAFVTVFRYELDCTEIWKDGQLVSLESKTNDDGDDDFVKLASNDDGTLRLEGSSYSDPALAPGIIPTSYWNMALIEQDRLLNTQSGRILNVSFTEIGRETVKTDNGPIEATRYRMEGDLDLDIWYDDNQRWVNIAFKIDDKNFTYELDTDD